MIFNLYDKGVAKISLDMLLEVRIHRLLRGLRQKNPVFSSNSFFAKKKIMTRVTTPKKADGERAACSSIVLRSFPERAMSQKNIGGLLVSTSPVRWGITQPSPSYICLPV
jgi:hypothetical protein